MNTIKINRGATKMIAHRGVSGLERENTNLAFVAAGNRSYFGVETDIHVTADQNLIVIHDDIDLDPGVLRIRKQGSAGGHNGIKSIIAHIGSEFPRVKVGVGEKPAQFDLADYVLSRFSKEEREAAEEAMDRAVLAIEKIIQGDMAGAMNEYNKKVER